MDEKLITFSNEPASKAIKSTVEAVELTSMGRVLNQIRNNK
jgi:tetrahydromethanopterin S-methyltransferase subunit F